MSNRGRSVLVLLLACLPPSATSAAEAPGIVLGLRTPAAEYRIGQTVPVKLEIRGAENVNGIKVHLLYDSSLLQFVPPAVEGPFLGSDGTNTVFLAGDRPEGGELKIGLARLSAGSGISGKGTLAELAFQAVAAGTVELELTQGGVKDPGKQDLPANYKGVRVLVVGD